MKFVDSIIDELFHIVVKCSFGFLGAITILVFALIVIKFSMLAWEHYVLINRNRLKPILEKYLSIAGSGIPHQFTNARWPLRAVLQYTIIYHSFGKGAEDIEKIAFLYEKLGFIDTDIKRLHSPFWWVRAEGARCLGQMRNKQSKAHLLTKLKDKKTVVRLVASWALGRLGDVDIIHPIIESLVSTSRLAGMRLSSTVFELGSKAIEPLINALAHKDDAVVILALHLLAELKDIKALPNITEKTALSQAMEVRLAAFKAMGTIAHPGSIPRLCEGLKDPAWQARAQAARGLGCIGGKESAESLRGALSDESWWVRRNAAEALTKLGERGKEILTEAAGKSQSGPESEMAAKWLNELQYLS